METGWDGQRSTTLTSCVGTRNAMPVSFPFSSGKTDPTALAAPVLGDDVSVGAAAAAPVFLEGPPLSASRIFFFRAAAL